MFTESDYDKLHQIMAESPQKKELLTKLLDSHRMDISTISHEIRNPLTLVYSTLQFIETSNPEVLNIRHWSDLHNDIEYMKQLLEELSAYNNGQRLSLSSTNFDTFLKKIVISFASSIINTDIEFISRIDSGLPVMPADSIKLKEVLLNLLGNAKDAVLTETSIPSSPQIRLNAHREGSSLSISVSDNGCGIAPEYLDTIFQPFVTYKSTGTGLGLPLSHRIVQAHGGTLSAWSDKNALKNGIRTIFTLTLPLCENR